jgi:hypothetical protein
MMAALGPATAARAQMMMPSRTPTYTAPAWVNPNPGAAGRANSAGSPFNNYLNPMATSPGQTPFNPALGLPITPAPAAQSYGGLPSGQTNRYGNVGTSSAYQNPYGNSGYGSYYETPEGGYLRGTAELVNSQAKWLVSLQQASLLREQASQARIETRRKQFDECVYEQNRTPSFEGNREALDNQRLMQSLSHPSQGDILSGHALNDILADIAKTDERAARGPVAALDNDILQHINLTSGKGASVGLLKNDGPLTWPVALLTERSKTDREVINGLLPQARRQALSGRVDSGTVKELAGASQRMRQQLKADVTYLSAKQYVEAGRFLVQLDDAVRVLSRPDVQAFMSQQNTGGKDVAALAHYMIVHGLWFAPAAPGDESAYVALHRALAAYDGARPQLVNEGAKY